MRTQPGKPDGGVAVDSASTAEPVSTDFSNSCSISGATSRIGSAPAAPPPRFRPAPFEHGRGQEPGSEARRSVAAQPAPASLVTRSARAAERHIADQIGEVSAPRKVLGRAHGTREARDLRHGSVLQGARRVAAARVRIFARTTVSVRVVLRTPSRRRPSYARGQRPSSGARGARRLLARRRRAGPGDLDPLAEGRQFGHVAGACRSPTAERSRSNLSPATTSCGSGRSDAGRSRRAADSWIGSLVYAGTLQQADRCGPSTRSGLGPSNRIRRFGEDARTYSQPGGRTYDSRSHARVRRRGCGGGERGKP